MNDRGKSDPFAQFQRILTDVERRIDGVANRVMGTDEFSRSMNTVQRTQLAMQKAFMEGMASYLNNLNMPSRDDITELGERLHGIERRLVDIEARLGGHGVAPAASPPVPARRGPPRTKRPPSAVGGSS